MTNKTNSAVLNYLNLSNAERERRDLRRRQQLNSIKSTKQTTAKATALPCHMQKSSHCTNASRLEQRPCHL